LLNQIKISKHEIATYNSEKIPVEEDKKYKITSKVIAKKGKFSSSYFGVFLLDSSDKEIFRRWKWITDFGGKENQYTIVFSTPKNVKSVIIGYRINVETALTSDTELLIEDLKNLKLETTEEEESFDGVPDYILPQLEPLQENQEDVLETKIVWILGSIRSGSTWLASELLDHPSNIYWHEPYIGWHLDAIREWHFGSERYFFSHHHKRNWIPSLRKLILARTYSQANTLTKNVIIKEPNGSGSADILMECFPKSKLIFLLRDGRDVVDSIMDAHRPDSWNRNNPITRFEPITSEKMHYDEIEKHSKDWKRLTETVWKAYQNHNSKLRLLIKYEDLRSNTFDELKKIYDFLNIDINTDDLHKVIQTFDFEKIPKDKKGPGKFHRLATPNAWRENFNKKELEIINSIMGDTLKKVGYTNIGDFSKEPSKEDDNSKQIQINQEQKKNNLPNRSQDFLKKIFELYENTKKYNRKNSKNSLYFDFLKMMLTDNILNGNLRSRFFNKPSSITELEMIESLKEIKNPIRIMGSLGDFGQAETMIGLMRLENLQFCVEDVLKKKVEGDLIETGIWKGGSCVFMKAILNEYEDKERTVYCADSFQGLPQPDPIYPQDKNSSFHLMNELKISLEDVEGNFKKYGLLDERVKFLKGWFKDTTKNPPFEKLSILRLDGDMYSSTWEVLKNLYQKLSLDGYTIIDDYGAVSSCKAAVDDFRQENHIKDLIQTIDWTGIYWKRKL